MRATRRLHQAVAFIGVGISGVTGCTGIGSRPANSVAQVSSPSPAALLGANHAVDALGRPVPGSAVSPDAHAEPAFKVNDVKRVAVALSMGQMLEEAGKLGEAQAYYEQALKLDSKNVKAELACAHIYARVGRPDAARKAYELAQKHHAKDAAVYNDLGMFLVEQKQTDAAIESLRKATKLEPSSAKFHNNLGVALAYAGRYDDAWSEFRDAVGPGPAHYNVALLLQAHGHIAECRERLAKAVETMPELNEARDALTKLDSNSITIPVARETIESNTAPALPASASPREPIESLADATDEVEEVETLETLVAPTGGSAAWNAVRAVDSQPSEPASTRPSNAIAPTSSVRSSSALLEPTPWVGRRFGSGTRR